MTRTHVLILMALITAGEGVAAPVFYSDSAACSRPHDTTTNSTFASSQSTDGLCHLGVSASGFAGSGGIGGQAQGTSDVTNFTAGGGSHLGRVSFTAVFRNASGTPGTTDIALNLSLSSQYSDPFLGQGGYVFLAVGTTIGGQIDGSSVTSVNPAQGSGLTLVGLGTANQLLTTSLRTVPLNVPVGIVYDLTTTAVVSGGTPQTEVVFLNAMNTLSFPKSGVVFTLAPGITVDDIPELLVFNNQFVQPSSAIPEPGTMALFGIAMAGFAGRNSFRRVRRG